MSTTSASVNEYGFVISNITPELSKKIKKELTVTPFSSFGNVIPNSFKVYTMIEEIMVVPIYYGLTLSLNYKINFDNQTEHPSFSSCNIILRPYQTECYTRCMEEKTKPFGGGIINLDTAFGKTILGLKIASSFGYKTLVIVNKIELLKQWSHEIKEKIPDAKVGIIQGQKFDIHDKDIVIGMLQTLSSQQKTPEDFISFGLVIIDEVHTIGSEVFSNIMFKIRPKYMFGLTATLERKDKLEQIIKWYIGDVIYSNVSTAKKQSSEIHVYPYTGVSSKPETLRDGTAAVSKMVSNIGTDKTRSNLIIEIILDLIKNSDRCILVLSDRIIQLKYLYKQLGSDISGLFIGSMKKEDLNETKTKQVILGSYGVCNQGFNHPKLNCLIFATPRSSITQSIGRVFRKQHTDVVPIIVDIFDKFSIFTGQHYRRKKIYKESITDCVFITKKQTCSDFKEIEFDLSDSDSDDCIGNLTFLEI